MTRILFYKHKHEFNYKILCVRESQHCRDSDYSFGCCFFRARAQFLSPTEPLCCTQCEAKDEKARARHNNNVRACVLDLIKILVFFSLARTIFFLSICTVSSKVHQMRNSVLSVLSRSSVHRRMKKLFLEHER